MTEVTVTERWHRWDGMRYRVWARPVPGSTAPPLVLVHGYAACVEQWGRFIRDIGPDIPIYAVDLIGFGESSKPRDATYGRAFYIEQLEHLRVTGARGPAAVQHLREDGFDRHLADVLRRGGVHRRDDVLGSDVAAAAEVVDQQVDALQGPE